MNTLENASDSMNTLLSNISQFCNYYEGLKAIKGDQPQSVKDLRSSYDEIEKWKNWVKENNQDELKHAEFAELESFQKQLKGLLLFFEALIPLIQTLFYIYFFKKFDTFLSSFEEEKIMGQKYRLTGKEIYDALKKMPERNALTLLKRIPNTDNACFDSLVDSLKNGEKDMFIQSIHKWNCDTANISFFLSVYRSLYNAKEEIQAFDTFGISQDNSDELFFNYICALVKDFSEDYNIYLSSMDAFTVFCAKIPTIKDEKDFFDSLPPFEKIVPDYKEILKDYLKDKASYTIQEIKAIEEIVKESHFIDIYKEVCLELSGDDHLNCQKEIIHEIEPQCDLSFILPDDYFDQKSIENNNLYFCRLQEYVKEKGSEIFMEFINYLAENGYIENTVAVKEKLAFCLTGIILSKSSMKIVDKIEWKKEARYLFYIISHFYKKWDCKRDRMKDIFSCKDPKFEKNISSFSSYAIRGDLNTKDPFLIKIRDLYPKIEDQKK